VQDQRLLGAGLRGEVEVLQGLVGGQGGVADALARAGGVAREDLRWLPDQRRAGRIRPNPLRASATNRRLTRLCSVSLSRVRLVVRRRR
jgi:hypothetical protein